MKPYKEMSLGNNEYIREFSCDVDIEELEWHIDKENRIVETIQNDNWKFQMDNELPILLKDKIYIPKETYHRILKGRGNLILKIKKLSE